MRKTFDYYRSTNSRLHVTLDQQDNYQKYLRRIEEIVTKKPHPDLSTSQHMGFLNKVRQISKNHRSMQQFTQINTQNQILLEKIVHAKNRKTEKTEDRYMLAMHQKRFREQERINEENKKIALRVISQESTIGGRKSQWTHQDRESPRRINEKTFYESRVKDRKLPKLLQIRS